MKAQLFFGALALATTLAAADPPYAGKWKMNPAKSDFGNTTFTYAKLPSGEWESTIDGQTYKFKMDEKDYPDAFGNIANWKAIDASSWQLTTKLNGKVITTDTFKVSADGAGLNISTKGTKPNGEVIENTMTAQRISGGPGLAGKWRTKNLKSASPSVLELAPSGADGMVYKVADMGLSCNAKLDGKDYPCSGPALPPGWSVAFAKPGAGALDLVVKKDGKQLYKMSYTVSADGKTLTESGAATATNEKVRVVYDRQ